jgi:hypothetical protein
MKFIVQNDEFRMSQTTTNYSFANTSRKKIKSEIESNFRRK